MKQYKDYTYLLFSFHSFSKIAAALGKILYIFPEKGQDVGYSKNFKITPSYSYHWKIVIPMHSIR